MAKVSSSTGELRNERLAALREDHPFFPANARDVIAFLPDTIGEEAILKRLAVKDCRPRLDLTGSDNRAGGSGGGLGVFLELGNEFLKTASYRRYTTAELALECEWNDELRRQRLGIYHPGRLWFLSRGADSAFWGCSLTPTMPVLREKFNARPQEGPDQDSWDLYLQAFRMTFELMRSESVLLDCNPNNFGLGGDPLYYLDDDLANRSGRMPFGHQALLRLREYETCDLELRVRFLKGFANLAEEYLGDDRLREGLLEDLEQEITWPREPELRNFLKDFVGRLAVPVRQSRGTISTISHYSERIPRAPSRSSPTSTATSKHSPWWANGSSVGGFRRSSFSAIESPPPTTIWPRP